MNVTLNARCFVEEYPSVAPSFYRCFILPNLTECIRLSHTHIISCKVYSCDNALLSLCTFTEKETRSSKNHLVKITLLIYSCIF